MTDEKPHPVEPETVECAVCMKEVPASEAVSPEGEEYLVHFCGRECYAAWERERAGEVKEGFARRSGVKRD
jgi:hypothetical protein